MGTPVEARTNEEGLDTTLSIQHVEFGYYSGYVHYDEKTGKLKHKVYVGRKEKKQLVWSMEMDCLSRLWSGK